MSAVSSSSAATSKTACDNASMRPANSSNSAVCMSSSISLIAMEVSVSESRISEQIFVWNRREKEASNV